MSVLPTLRQMEYLVALEVFGSFSRAAENCHVTQSTLSAGIATLEDLLGQQLADRSQRQITLTPLGQEIADKGRKLLRDAADIMQRADQLRAPLAGPLRLGVIPTIAPYILPRFLPLIKQDLPAMELSLQEDLSARLLEKLESGQLDIALMAFPYDTPGMTQTPLGKEAFYLTCPAGSWAKARPIRLKDLQDKPLLLLEEGHCLRDHALEACRLQPPSSRSTFSATSLPTLVQMVRHGYGMTLLPEMALENVKKSDALEIIPFAAPVPARTIGLVWRQNSPRAETYGKIAGMLAGLMKKLKSDA